MEYMDGHSTALPLGVVAKSHVALVSFLAPGHIAPFIAFAAQLHRSFSPTPRVTLYILALKSRLANTSYPPLPPGVAVSTMVLDLPDLPNMEPLFQYLPYHKDALVTALYHHVMRDVNSRGIPAPRCVVADMFMGWTQSVAVKFGIPFYVLFPSPILVLDAFVLRGGTRPRSGDKVGCSFLGAIPVEWLPEAMPPPLQALKSHIRTSRGVLVNDIKEQYPPELPLFEQIRLLPVGYLKPEGSPRHYRDCGSEVNAWLSVQKLRTVVYVALGSWGHLRCRDQCELAFALEAAGLPFLWALRPKPKGWKFQPTFGPPEDDDCPVWLDDDGLPRGWRRRVGDRGLVVPWTSQVDVLRSGRVGVFVSHCGWNSLIESFAVGGGIPIAALPVAAEQAVNACMLEVHLKAGKRLWPCAYGNNLDRERVANVILELSASPSLAANARKCHDASVKAWASGGSSRRSLTEFVTDVMSFVS